MSTPEECRRLCNEWARKEIEKLPSYAFGSEDGQRYPKLRFTDPIHARANEMYARMLEILAAKVVPRSS